MAIGIPAQLGILASGAERTEEPIRGEADQQSDRSLRIQASTRGDELIEWLHVPA